MDALEAIMTRQSIRSYTGEGISRQMLRQIVSAGMQAPSAHACASWRFLTITDRRPCAGLSLIARGGGCWRRPLH